MSRRPRRRRGLRRLFIGGLVLLGLVALLTAGNTVTRYWGLTVAAEDPERISALISPYYGFLKPSGPGPFPTALLFSGCDGVRDNMYRWASMLNERGWAAVIVDSHAPRGLEDYNLWRMVCAGQLLLGSERAGDALVALRDVRRMDAVDATRILLIGASHGAWTIMDLLVQQDAGELPLGLSALPEGLPSDAPLAGVVGQILLYPYCGLANRARQSGWRHPAPTLMLLSGDDSITPSQACKEVAGLQENHGMPLKLVVFEGIDHGFDQQERAAFSPLVFDPETTAEALRIAAAFIDGLALPEAKEP